SGPAPILYLMGGTPGWTETYLVRAGSHGLTARMDRPASRGLCCGCGILEAADSRGRGGTPLNRIDALRTNYARYVYLPWDRSLPGPQRIWFAVYDPLDERRLRLRLPSFEIATKEAGHGWHSCDLTCAFAHWMADQDYRGAYFESPEDF